MYYFDYTENNDRSSVLVHIWEESSWNYYFKTSYEYNLDKTEINHYVEFWNRYEWLLIDRYTHYLNIEGFLLNSKYEYKTVNNSWVPGNGILHVVNPDGFKAHFWASEVVVYYNEPTIVKVNEEPIPEGFKLHQNYPNPFNPTTNIEYTISRSELGNQNSAQVTLTIYNTLGQETATLVNQKQSAGTYSVTWDAGENSSGVYFYILKAGEKTLTKKMVFIR
jgi:hypothetical protein